MPGLTARMPMNAPSVTPTSGPSLTSPSTISSQVATGMSGVTTYSCMYCSRSFYLRSDLVRHVRIHTGEKPFSCPYCGHATARKSSLKKHILSKHPEVTNDTLVLRQQYSCESDYLIDLEDSESQQH